METIYITHPLFRLHEMGAEHPEAPFRLDAIDTQLQRTGLADLLRFLQAKKATDEDLLRVHSLHHIANLKQNAPQDGYYSIDADTRLNVHTLEAAYHAAGAGLLAVDEVFSTTSRTAFCAVRPPGHHACFDQAMGFCFFNNIAVAAAYALEKYELDQVVIVDFDVHHGNGTEDIFAHNDKVQMFGFYQHPLFPGSRHSPPAANMYNEPVPADADSATIRHIVNTYWLPQLRQLKPKLLLISAGFDAHQDDEMGQLQLGDEDFAWITQQVMQATTESTQGRVISMLEGGYDPASLSRSVQAHLQVLAGLVNG
ncbi:histone deacetylase family protein [Paenalcaligenes faecalis]|uniref:histone deacetylase family protein n=1 Tax=Paenalcaligenes faecalis TaxID=2980099 RepID=UPI0022B9CB31|nr:histone deacetylase family protein [Paenalcaligenes faecalis]